MVFWVLIQFWIQTELIHIHYPVWIWICGEGDFYFVLYSTLLHLPPLRFHCDAGMLGSNPGPLQLLHWQSDALTTRLDLIRIQLTYAWMFKLVSKFCTTVTASRTWELGTAASPASTWDRTSTGTSTFRQDRNARGREFSRNAQWRELKVLDFQYTM